MLRIGVPTRSDPTAQQSARISGTTPSGCADAPPRETKDEALTPALSQISGLLVQLPDLGVEGSSVEVVIILRRQKQISKANSSKKFQAACLAAGSKLGDYTQWVR